MFFRNAQIYRLPAGYDMTAVRLSELLASQVFRPATSAELTTSGWVPPTKDGNLVRTVNKQLLIALQTEKKLLPGSVITQVAKAKAAELEEQQGFPVGRKAMKELQLELIRLQRGLCSSGRRLLVIFEGRDAAGKGGTIKAITESLDTRDYRIAALPKPDEREASQWYFQRYVAHLPCAGEFVLFDRSWYNRAVVEPAMGFCSQQEYEAFLEAVPTFEKLLTDDGIILLKYWLAVDQAEQEERFAERADDPLKRWKLSPVDLVARQKYAEMGKLLGLEAMARLAIQQDLASVRIGMAAEDVQQRGLARAVGADQADQFARGDIDADIVHGGQAAITFHDTFGGQQTHVDLTLRTSSVRIPHRPSRKKRAKITTSAANTTS